MANSSDSEGGDKKSEDTVAEGPLRFIKAEYDIHVFSEDEMFREGSFNLHAIKARLSETYSEEEIEQLFRDALSQQIRGDDSLRQEPIDGNRQEIIEHDNFIIERMEVTRQEPKQVTISCKVLISFRWGK